MFVEKRSSSGLAAQPTSRIGVERVVLVGSGDGIAEVLYGLRGAAVDTTVVGAPIEVLGVDAWRRRLLLGGAEPGEIEYDRLVIATGERFSFVGENRWHAASQDEVLAVRVRLASEYAESEPDPVERARLLTFVVAGGVQVAHAVAKLIETEIAPELRETARLILVGGARPEPREVAADHVVVGEGRIEAATVIRVDGIAPAEAAAWFGAAMDGSKQVLVTDRCTLPGHDHVYVVDASRGRGTYVASAIWLGCVGGLPGPFRSRRSSVWESAARRVSSALFGRPFRTAHISRLQ